MLTGISIPSNIIPLSQRPKKQVALRFEGSGFGPLPETSPYGTTSLQCLTNRGHARAVAQTNTKHAAYLLDFLKVRLHDSARPLHLTQQTNSYLRKHQSQ